MARIALLAHISVEVPDADEVAWETPETSAPTVLRRLLRRVLGNQPVIQVPQTSAPGRIVVETLRVEWPGDHALRVLQRTQECVRNAQEIRVDEGQTAPSGRSNARYPWDVG